MTAVVSVTYDKDDDLIVQHIQGDMTLDDFDKLERYTAECVAKMTDPSSVRILVDAREIRRLNQRVRKHSIRRMKDAHHGERVHLALWGASPLESMFLRFLEIVRGEGFVKPFPTEQEARAWLRSLRTAPGVNHG